MKRTSIKRKHSRYGDYWSITIFGWQYFTRGFYRNQFWMMVDRMHK